MHQFNILVLSDGLLAQSRSPSHAPPSSLFSAASFKFIFQYWKSDLLRALYLGNQLTSLPETSLTNGSHLHQQNTWPTLPCQSPQATFFFHSCSYIGFIAMERIGATCRARARDSCSGLLSLGCCPKSIHPKREFNSG